MSPKKNCERGVIIFHTPIHKELFISEDYIEDLQDEIKDIKRPSQPSVKSSNSSRDQRTGSKHEAHNSTRSSSQLLNQDRRSRPSTRRLQAKMEAEKQQTREEMQHLRNTETGFVKELENFVNQHDIAERRRKELLHKRWSERVWMPLQRKLERRVSSCGSVDINRRQDLYSHFLQHCNSKGHVFLETYNRKEYDPFLCRLKKSHYLKLAESKDTGTTSSSEAESKVSRRQDDTLPQNIQSSLAFGSSVTSQSHTGQQTPSSRPVSTSTSSKETNSEKRKPIRFGKILGHINRENRRCPRADCWFSSAGSEL